MTKILPVTMRSGEKNKVGLLHKCEPLHNRSPSKQLKLGPKICEMYPPRSSNVSKRYFQSFTKNNNPHPHKQLSHKIFFSIRIQSQESLYNEESSLLNRFERDENPNHFLNEWLRLKYIMLIINDGDLFTFYIHGS